MRLKSLLFILLFFISLTLASPVIEENKNLILSTINVQPYMGNTYSKLFKLKIENKSPCSFKDEIIVHYNISGLNGIDFFKNDSFRKKIGCSSSASTGFFHPTVSGDYQICGSAIPLSFNETDLVDNNFCYFVSVLDTSNSSCDFEIDLNFKLTTNLTFNNDHLFLYQEGESLKFNPLVNEKDGQEFPFMIEYWIEDLFGDIVKSKRNTTNTNQKSWKTRLVNAKAERIFKVVTKVSPSCNDLNKSDNFVEKVFLVIAPQLNINETNNGMMSEIKTEPSTINITKIHQTNISFGDLIRFDTFIYKNKTNKYSLSAWVEREEDNKITLLSEKTKFHLKTREQEYKLMLPIQLKFKSNYLSGPANLIVEGLGLRTEKKLFISGVNTGSLNVKEPISATKSGTSTKSKLSYQIIEFPQSVLAGNHFNMKVELQGDQKEHDFKVWAYLYRGNKCYSCSNGEQERDANLQEIVLLAEETRVVVLNLIADANMEVGDYKLKVKLNKDGQKTDYELTENISIIGPALFADACQCNSVQTLSPLSGERNLFSQSGNSIYDSKGQLVSEQSYLAVPATNSKITIYESNSEKAYNLTPYLLILTFGLLSLVLLLKRS